MTTPIFPREVDFVDVREVSSFQSNVHVGSNGVERRTKGLGPASDISSNRRSLVYTMNADDNVTDVDTVKAFFEARDGMYEAFFMPSFKIDTTITASVSSGTTLTVADSSVFQASIDNGYGNWIVVWDVDNDSGEARRVTAIPGGGVTVTINQAITGSYVSGDYVEIAILGRFSDNAWGRVTHDTTVWTPDPVSVLEVFEYGSVVL